MSTISPTSSIFQNRTVCLSEKESGAISQIGYNVITNNLYVYFRNGGVYEYKDFHPTMMLELIEEIEEVKAGSSTASIDKYYNEKIKKEFPKVKKIFPGNKKNSLSELKRECEEAMENIKMTRS
jgi:hypothetical protein